MGSTQGKNVVVITIITVCALGTALWLAGVMSHAALSRLKDKSASAAEAPNLTALAEADKPARLRANEEYGKLPLSFEVNQGQTDAQVKFISRGAGYSLFLTSTEAVLSLQRNRRAPEARGRGDKGSVGATTDVLRMKLVGANPAPKVEGSDELPGKSNYFIGNNPNNWRVNVSTFAKVHYREVYPGVDVVYYGNQRNLENDFIVGPGVDPGVIALAFEGANKISIDQGNSLVLSLARGRVQLQKPVIYQLIGGVRREVAGNYVLRNQREVGFEVAAYDLTKPLVIDPVLIYSFPLVGNSSDSGNAIAVDASGNAYITGDTTSSVFPTASPFDSTLGGGRDAFVAKINAAGTALVYSTYLGGSNVDYGFDLAIDGAGNAYITGRTSSNDFPAVNAFDSTYSGGSNEDAYVARLNAAGSALVYSTYLSGTFGARGWGIATDGAGNAYVTGTTSTGFPVTAATAFDSTAFNTGFMSKLNTNGSGASSLLYSTFLGHTGVGEGRAIAADATGNVYVTGNLSSTATSFASAGAFQTTFGGGFQDAFVEKFNTNLSGAASRVYSTYLGGSGQDFGGGAGAFDPGKAIAIDASGNAYITGQTTSTNFPTANAFQGANGGNTDAFLSKLNAAGSALIYSTYLGGSGSSSDQGRGVAVNVVGNAYVTGLTNSDNFPTTPTPPTLSTTGGIFVTKFTPSGTAPLAYSTRLVSSSGDKGFGIALDDAGNAFVTGSTGSDVFLNEIADPTIIGRVVDEDGSPISSATVNLTGVPTATTTTDANGYFTFGLLTVANNYTVSVSVPNYTFNSQVVNNLQKNVRTANFVGVQSNPTPTPTPTPTPIPTPTPTPMTVQFSASTATATETLSATTKLDLTVIRSGNTSGTATVNYASSDLTASERSDYLVAIGTVRFQAGETAKTISVFIVDDSFGEAAETFNLTLTNPVGCVLGSPPAITVTINSNETVDGPNPVQDASFSSDFFVRQHYVDFFNREADAAGLAFWKNQIDECTTQPCREIRRINVSAAFFLSIEFQQTGYLVYKANQAGFNSGEQLELRDFLADTQEIGRGVIIGQPGANQQLEINKQNFFNAFVQRPSFLAPTAYPTTLTASQFVDKLNGNTFDPRNPAGGALTQSERDTLVAQLSVDPTSPTLRSQALRSVSENGVFTQRQFNKAFVLMQYFGYLRRNPDATPDTNFDGYNFWLTKLNQLNGNFVGAEMVKAFITSSEYIQRFGPSSTPTPTPTPGSTVVIDRPSVFFPAIGMSTQLTAQILDAQGVPSPGSVRWTSTAPDRVSVDATGKVMAMAIGSSQIIAEAAGVRSAPTLVIVAQPQFGALLVTDAQVVSVGPPLGLLPGASPGVGTQYEVTLNGVAAPTPGTVMLAAETAPIAGKVIATRQDAGGLVVTLALAPLYELFSAYDIAWTIDLSAFPLEAVPAQSPQGILSAQWNAERRGKPRAMAAARQLAALEPFRAFDCDASIKPQLLGAPIQLSPEINLKLVVMDRPGYSKHALEGSATLTGSAGLKLKAGFNASGRCEAKAQIKLPVFGAVSVIVMPAVHFGLGAEISGEVLLVQGELGVEGKVGFSPVVGWECGGSTPACRGLDDITSVNEFKTKSKIPSENDMQAKVSAQFYILAGLDLAIFAGAINAEILEARIGPKQSFDLAFEEDQAARADYASSYDLKLEGVVEPGSALKKAIELVIGDDSTGVRFKAEVSTDISESPKGSLSVSQTKVRAGTPVDFTVVLTPNTLDYFLLGYNVTGVELYRKREDEPNFTPWKSMSQVASNRATYHWEPAPADVGKYEFAAFVNTRIPVTLLEVAPNSIQKVEVSCFGPSSPAAKGSRIGQVSTCADTWVGTASTGNAVYGPNQTEATLTLKVDTSIEGLAPGQVIYYAEGTVNVRNPALEQIGCTLTPTQFIIDRTGSSHPGQEITSNQFEVLYGDVPATFGGAGTLLATQTVTCPGQAPRTVTFGYPFFTSSSGLNTIHTLSADGLTIQGSHLPFYTFQLARP